MPLRQGIEMKFRTRVKAAAEAFLAPKADITNKHLLDEVNKQILKGVRSSEAMSKQILDEFRSSEAVSKQILGEFRSLEAENKQILNKIGSLEGKLPRPMERPIDLAPIDSAFKRWPTRTERCSRYISQALKAGELSSGRVLEVGGRENPRERDFAAYEYVAVDLEKTADNVIVADITDCPEIPNASFDFVFSIDVFEHIQTPWKAAAEIDRILKPGGVTYHTTLFSWRYHPCPGDYWRYTPEAFKVLFPNLECVAADFDQSERRRDITGIGHAHPIVPDELGGWRENWRVHYIGRKPSP